MTVHRWMVEKASDDKLATAMQLVHDAYVRAGYILPVHGGVRGRVWNNSANTVTFMAEQDGVVVGVISIVRDSTECGLPSDRVFGAEIDGLRADGLVSEVTNLAILPDVRSPRLPLVLAEACREQAIEWGCRYAFVAISPGHARFFKRAFGFVECGEQRNCSDELTDMVQGMVLEFE